MTRIAVLGTGGWGTAIAGAAAANAHRVTLWGRDPAHVAEIVRTRRNERGLPGVEIDRAVTVTASAEEAASGAEIAVVAIPAQFARAALAPFRGTVPRGAIVVSATKGLEIGTGLRPSEVFAAALGPRAFAVLSGPSHAEEIARGLPASLAVASEDLEAAKVVRDCFASSRLRVYAERDVAGVEVAGALKNVIAIAAGLCDGLELGDNAKAALVTRGLAEMTRFGVARGAVADTFSGLAGIGDLLTTCYSRYGRNRAVGERLGRGEKAAAILGSMTQVAEGAGTARALRESGAADDSAMPICAEVHAILYEDKDPRRSVVDLMTRPPRET